MAVANTRTDSHGRFTIDLSKASVQVPMPVPRSKTEMMREWPAPGSLYLIARGGDAGAGANPAAALMLALGDTNGLHTITINEITTVVATLVYARSMVELAGHNLPLSEATAARALVDPESGALRPIFSDGVNSPAPINTLADLVAACVRSAGPNSHPCAALFAAAPSVDRPRAPYGPTPAPADTIVTLENIALWPQRNVEELFALLPAKPPYLPVLTSTPRAFMITLNFARGGFNRPAGIALDPARKAVWIANQGGNSVIELSTDGRNFGMPLSPPSGFTGGGLHAPTAIRFIPIAPPEAGGAIPAAPSLWVTNRDGDSLTEILLPPVGEPAVPKLRRITGNGLKAPVDLAEIGGNSYSNVGGRMLPNQFVAVANSRANVVSLFKPLDGSPCGSPVRIEGLKDADGIGWGINGIWIADATGNALFEIEQPNAACSDARFLEKITGAGLSAPRFLTWGSQSGTLAVTNPGNNSVAVFTHQLTGNPRVPYAARALGGSPFTGGGLKGPAGIAIDGDANAWVANNAPGANSISEIARVTEMFGNAVGTGMPLSPPGGFSGAGLDRPYGIVIDGNGNIWVTNQAGNSVTVFIGVCHAPY